MAPLAAQDLILPCGLKLKNRLVKVSPLADGHLHGQHTDPPVLVLALT